MTSVGCVDDACIPDTASEDECEGLSLSKISSQIGSSLVKACIEKYGTKAIKKAFCAYKNVKSIKPSYLPTKELFKIIVYIENEFQKAIGQGITYHSRKRSGLSCPIEYDPASNLTFIHLAPYKESQLGAGVHKRVTVSIKYDKKSSELVANNSFKRESEDQEINTLKTLHGDAGLLKTLAFTKHTKTSGKTIFGFVTKLYNLGPLGRSIKNQRKFTSKEIVTIARDLLIGLKNIHNKGFCHRDLHNHNIVLDENIDPKTKKKKISAVFIDFGRAEQATQIGDNFPQASKKLNPPEFFTKERKYEDHKLSDIYALGVNLFHLMYLKLPPWNYDLLNSFDKLHMLKMHERIEVGKKLADRIDQYITPRMKKLSKMSKKKPFEEFKFIVLKMLSSNPKERPHASKLIDKVECILKKM